MVPMKRIHRIKPISFAVGGLLLLGLCGCARETPFVQSGANESYIERFYEESRHNKAYCPTKREIYTWIVLIEQESSLENPVPFYLALILAESSGNPTTKMDGGMSRGLGCVSVNAARDVIKRRGMKVDNVSIALYNPRFNIVCMVDHYEYLLNRFGSRKWSMTYYNAGVKKVSEWVGRGIGIKHSHWKRVQEKLSYLEGGD